MLNYACVGAKHADSRVHVQHSLSIVNLGERRNAWISVEIIALVLFIACPSIEFLWFCSKKKLLLLLLWRAESLSSTHRAASTRRRWRACKRNGNDFFSPPIATSCDCADAECERGKKISANEKKIPEFFFFSPLFLNALSLSAVLLLYFSSFSAAELFFALLRSTSHDEDV